MPVEGRFRPICDVQYLLKQTFNFCFHLMMLHRAASGG